MKRNTNSRLSAIISVLIGSHNCVAAAIESGGEPSTRPVSSRATEKKDKSGNIALTFGDGYLTTSLEGVSRCFEPKTGAKQIETLAGGEESRVMFDSSTVEEAFGLQVGVGASYSLFNATDTTASETQSAMSSTGLVFADIAKVADKTGYAPSDFQLTETGAEILKMLVDHPDSPDVLNNFIMTCGTHVVTGVTYGKEAQFEMVLTASSSNSKSSFKNDLSVGAESFVSISNKIESSNSQNKKSIAVSVKLHQNGGDTNQAITAVPSAIRCSADETTGGLTL